MKQDSKVGTNSRQWRSNARIRAIPIQTKLASGSPARGQTRISLFSEGFLTRLPNHVDKVSICYVEGGSRWS